MEKNLPSIDMLKYYVICADGTVLYVGDSEEDMLATIQNFQDTTDEVMYYESPHKLNDFGGTDKVFTVIRGFEVKVSQAGWKVVS